MSPTAGIARVLFSRSLNERGPALNIARLLSSRHLADLQWTATLAVFAIVAIVTTIYAHGLHWFQENSAILTTSVGAALAIGNWSYQSGNRRLGTIDLFACEIGVICRVWLVIDFARTAVAIAQAQAVTGGATIPMPAPFAVDDDYTPVHDQQLANLVPFDVSVVTTVTEFYTYRQTMIDYLHSRGTAASEPEVANFTDQMLYMFYLSCEAGRMAISQLVEFEPNEAESLINILCSEIVVYGYLLTVFTDDYRGDRLRLRRERYEAVIAGLRRQIQAGHPHWRRANTTFPELERRYADLCRNVPAAEPAGH